MYQGFWGGLEGFPCGHAVLLLACLPYHYVVLTSLAGLQVWRPLRAPVQDSPLGMLDAATVCKDDLMSYSLHFPGRTGYNYAAKYSPAHM